MSLKLNFDSDSLNRKYGKDLSRLKSIEVIQLAWIIMNEVQVERDRHVLDEVIRDKLQNVHRLETRTMMKIDTSRVERNHRRLLSI